MSKDGFNLLFQKYWDATAASKFFSNSFFNLFVIFQ